MNKRISGFTVVEVMVIIVIIGVLASVTIVSYRGVQERARTAQTLTAANQWIKVLQTYKARNGAYPNVAGCLGANYGWGVSNSKTQGTAIGQCRQDTAAYGLTSSSALDAMLASYSSAAPSPSMVTASNSATDWRRGIYYYINGASPAMSRIDLVIEDTQCPKLGQYTAVVDSLYSNGKRFCAYEIGRQAGY